MWLSFQERLYMYFFFILCSFCFNFVWWHCYYCNKPVSSTLMILWRCQYEDEFAKPGKPELMHWWLLRDYQSTKTIAFVYCTPLVCLCSLYLSISVTHKHVPNLITQNTWKYSVSNKKCAAIDECIWNINTGERWEPLIPNIQYRQQQQQK